VATTGTWNIHPNVFNAVPRGASILIDIRDIKHETRQQVIDAVLNGAEEVGKKYKCPTKADVVYAHPPIHSAVDVSPAVTSSMMPCLRTLMEALIWEYAQISKLIPFLLTKGRPACCNRSLVSDTTFVA
jgi:acetylornithine deacetylase/succinyl-diaminopimelate desuccinylase-like protein